MANLKIPAYIVNAFTKEPFKGNPAAVCLLERDKDVLDAVKQRLAAEFNLSETAFVAPVEAGTNFTSGSKFSLRWFTPTVEVALCGHATLATAAVLFNNVGNTNKKITFETLSGQLFVEKMEDGKIGMIFPSYTPVSLDENIADTVKIAVGDLPYQEVKYSPDLTRLMIRLKDSVTRTQFEGLFPNTDDLFKSHNDGTITGVVLTLKGTNANGFSDDNGQVYDFVSRFFAPWMGVPEDPVCGSAHTMLAPYWSAELGKKNLFALQCSKRSGELWIDTSIDSKVIIKGESFIAVQGSLQL